MDAGERHARLALLLSQSCVKCTISGLLIRGWWHRARLSRHRGSMFVPPQAGRSSWRRWRWPRNALRGKGCAGPGTAQRGGALASASGPKVEVVLKLLGPFLVGLAEAGAFRNVLPDQPVDVLVRVPLPAAAGLGRVHRGRGFALTCSCVATAIALCFSSRPIVPGALFQRTSQRSPRTELLSFCLGELPVLPHRYAWMGSG